MDKNKPMMMIIIALLVLLLGTIVAVTFYLISTFGGEDEVDTPVQAPARIVQPNEIDWRELDELRVILQDPPPGRQNVFLIATFLIGVNNTAPSRELSAFDLAFNYTVAQSVINEVLFATPYNEARTPEGRAAVEERILGRLQMEFGPLVVSVRSIWTLT